MYLQGEIYLANLNPSLWKEQSWIRPILIISWDSFNKNWNILMICPITSKLKNLYWDLILKPTKENWLKENSEILCCQIRTITVERLIKKIGKIKQEEIQIVINWVNILLKY